MSDATLSSAEPARSAKLPEDGSAEYCNPKVLALSLAAVTESSRCRPLDRKDSDQCPASGRGGVPVTLPSPLSTSLMLSPPSVVKGSAEARRSAASGSGGRSHLVRVGVRVRVRG